MGSIGGSVYIALYWWVSMILVLVGYEFVTSGLRLFPSDQAGLLCSLWLGWLLLGFGQFQVVQVEVVEGVLCLLIVVGVLVTWSVPSRIAGVVVGVVAVSEQGSRGRLLSWSLSEPPTVLLRLWLWLWLRLWLWLWLCLSRPRFDSLLPFFVLGAAGIA